jgi:hypothetical protein
MGWGALSVLSINGNVGVGTPTPAGRLNISEATGTAHGPNAGTLVIDHENNGGASSIVFRSKVNRGSDYGFIQYQDAETVGGGGESARLIIGISNDADDHIILSPGAGNVGIGINKPRGKLDVTGAIYAGGSDIYFTETTHTHTGIGNSNGYAAIENASNFDCLMILGRAKGTGGTRKIGMWDNVDVSGTLTAGGLTVPGAAVNLRILGGTIDSGGGILSPGMGFRVARASTGIFDIYFDTAFSAMPFAAVSQIYPDTWTFNNGGNTKDNAVIVGINQNRLRVKTGNADGDATNRFFSFIVMGQR